MAVDGTNNFLRYMVVVIWQREVFTNDRMTSKKGRKKALYTVPHTKMTWVLSLIRLVWPLFPLPTPLYGQSRHPKSIAGVPVPIGQTQPCQSRKLGGSWALQIPEGQGLWASELLAK